MLIILAIAAIVFWSTCCPPRIQRDRKPLPTPAQLAAAWRALETDR